MPIYEFECGSCGSVNEFTMKFSDPNPEKCPECGQGPMQKLISRSAFQLKGGGWYTDAYDSKDQISKSKKAAEDKTSDKSGEKSSGDSKKEASADTGASDSSNSSTSKDSKPSSDSAKPASKSNSKSKSD